jgi:hypothetical protein
VLLQYMFGLIEHKRLCGWFARTPRSQEPCTRRMLRGIYIGRKILVCMHNRWGKKKCSFVIWQCSVNVFGIILFLF